MIERAVFSYFNANHSFNNACGFRRFSDFLYTTNLALFMARRHFKEVVLISDDWGVDIFKQIKAPVTEYSNSFNDLKNVSQYFWAYGKLIAYTEQKKPFVHIDNDVFLWKPLPERMLKADLCFQSHEPFDKPGYGWYDLLKIPWRSAPIKPQQIVDNEVTDFAYNCGVCGGNNLPFFKEWRKCSEEYIFAPENQKIFFEDFQELLIHQNLFHEQYFAASLIQKYNLRSKVQVYAEDAMMINDGCEESKPRYTHVWGTAKRNGDKMARIKLTLLYAHRPLFDRIHKFCVDNHIEIGGYDLFKKVQGPGIPQNNSN